jgi:hypothetical protein
MTTRLGGCFKGFATWSAIRRDRCRRPTSRSPETLDPTARDDLRRVLIHDQADRDAISSRLMRYRDQNGKRWADFIDFLTMWPDARRRVGVRLLAEIEAR